MGLGMIFGVGFLQICRPSGALGQNVRPERSAPPLPGPLPQFHWRRGREETLGSRGFLCDFERFGVIARFRSAVGAEYL